MPVGRCILTTSVNVNILQTVVHMEAISYL